MDRSFVIGSEELGEMLAAVPDFIIAVDRVGLIMYINHVEEGYDRDQVIGSSVNGIVHPDSLEVFHDALNAAFETGLGQKYEVMITAPDGLDQWYESKLFPIQREGTVVAAMLMASNVTQVKAARERMDQLRRLLPICSWCDRIKTDDGKWVGIESYLKKEIGTDITHALCPDCLERELASGGANEGAA